MGLHLESDRGWMFDTAGVSIVVQPWRLCVAAAAAILRWRYVPWDRRIVPSRLSDAWLRQHEMDADKHRDDL
jgi:hypothetical protein